ncbi:MAG: polyprenyl synthetase family protein [Thermoplasmata archaeon]|nr:polyprenyl synthetase family protein [Thermoplasmata archaeon]
MDFSELAAYRPRLEKRLRSDYAGARRGAAIFGPFLDDLSEFTLRGGKRFRALLLLAGYHLATGRDPEVVLPAAAALEHFQSWMLIHDDIIDHSEQRRGGPALHRAIARRHEVAQLLGDADAYGVGLGITLGDLEEPFTVAALLSVKVPVARRHAALAEYVRMTRDTAYGQLLDIQNGATPVERIREADVLRVHELKSAVYTVASPLRLGAMLGGGSGALLGDLEAIGIDLGIAFQLRDDILGTGVGGDLSGKSANDLIEGKRTLLVVQAFAKADASGRAVLEAVLGEPAASPDQVRAAQELIVASGSLAYSEERIERLTRAAFRRIDHSKALRPAGRALLTEIGERLVRRAT